MQEKIKDLPEDVKKAITDYVEAHTFPLQFPAHNLSLIIFSVMQFCKYFMHDSECHKTCRRM